MDMVFKLNNTYQQVLLEHLNPLVRYHTTNSRCIYNNVVENLEHCQGSRLKKQERNMIRLSNFHQIEVFTVGCVISVNILMHKQMMDDLGHESSTHVAN